MNLQSFIAQFFGICATTSLILAYQQTDRKRLLIRKLSDDICWMTYYLILGGTGGMITSLIGIFREIIFYQRGKNKFFNSKIIPITFFLLNWIVGIALLVFKPNIGWIQMLPIVSSSLITISLWVKRPKLTKIISLPVLFVFLAYNLALTFIYHIPSYMGILNQILGISSIVISLLRSQKTSNK